MGTLTIYFDISPEIADLLNERAISVEDIVRQSSHEVAYGPLRLVGEDDRSKDIVPIVIATTAGLSALLLSISNLLNTYFHRPHYYEWDELEEVRERGKLIKDNKGNPLWKIRRKHKLIYPQELGERHSIEFSAGISGLILRLTSSKENEE